MAINTTKVANSEPVSDGFLLNSTNQYYIDVTGGDKLDDISDAKWARLAKGIASVTPAGNELITTLITMVVLTGLMTSLVNDHSGHFLDTAFTETKHKTLLQVKNLLLVKLLKHVCCG